MQLRDTDPFAEDRISLAERTEAYLDSLPSVDQEAAIDIASSIKTSQPLAGTVVNIPVAAHQDTDLIIPAMEQYNNQRGAAPFSVVLHPNIPADASEYSTAKRLYDTITQAQRYFPHLDIRSSLLTPYENPTIGEVRKNLWLGTLALSFAEHGMKHDVIGINHDIDVVKISPHYVARVQQYYDKRIARQLKYDVVGSHLRPAATRVSHAVIASHPHTAAVTQWNDNTCFQSPHKIGYEAGMVIPMSHYIKNGGFNASDKTHETRWLRDSNHSHPYIVGAQLLTSPRRYAARLHQVGSNEIWTKNTFSHSDECRNNIPPDISMDRAESVIKQNLITDITWHWATGRSITTLQDICNDIMMGENPTTILRQGRLLIEQQADQQLRKAERFMRLVVGSTVLADFIASEFKSSELASLYLNDYIGNT